MISFAFTTSSNFLLALTLFRAVEKGGQGGASPPSTISWGKKIFFPHNSGKHKIFICE